MPLLESLCHPLCPVHLSHVWDCAFVAAVATTDLFLLLRAGLSLGSLTSVSQGVTAGRHSVSAMETFPGASVCCACSDRLWECFCGLWVSAGSWRARERDLPWIPGRAEGLQCSLPGLRALPPCCQPAERHPTLWGALSPPLSSTGECGLSIAAAALGRKNVGMK